MKTACLIKPDAYPIYAGEIISRLIGQGFKIRLAGEIQFDQLMLDGWYYEHVGKGFYENLCNFMREGPALGLILEHEEQDVVRFLRHVMGPTKIEDRMSSDIRGEFGHPTKIERNVIHGSDSEDAARYEVALLEAWFGVRGPVVLRTK